MYSHEHIKTSEGSRWDVLASFQLISLEGVESYDTISGASSKDLHGKKKKKKKACVIKLNLQVIFEKVEEEKPILLVLMWWNLMKSAWF